MGNWGCEQPDADLYVERVSTEDSALKEVSSVSGLLLLQVLFSS